MSSQFLITGGAGFIGSHLAETLLARGERVQIIDDLSTGRFANIAHLADNPLFHFTIDSIDNETVLEYPSEETGNGTRTSETLLQGAD